MDLSRLPVGIDNRLLHVVGRDRFGRLSRSAGQNGDRACAGKRPGNGDDTARGDGIRGQSAHGCDRRLEDGDSLRIALRCCD